VLRGFQQRAHGSRESSVGVEDLSGFGGPQKLALVVASRVHICRYGMG